VQPVRRFSRPILLASLALAAIVLPASSQAVTLSFDCITNNSATDCGIATSQLSVGLVAVGSTQASLTITNDGPLASVYARVLVDGTVLSAVDAITNAPPGVVFAAVSPGVLPGGNGNPINFTADLEVAANNPMPQRGVGPGESLGITFSIASGFDFQDVLDALADGSLRIGMHVQAFASGGSESVLNTPVPEAHTLALLALGLTGLGVLGRPRD
jgi:hypothetical protein